VRDLASAVYDPKLQKKKQPLGGKWRKQLQRGLELTTEATKEANIENFDIWRHSTASKETTYLPGLRKNILY
jgi:hypothetical protein